MFGLPGFPKLLLLAAVVTAVWYFLRRSGSARGSGGEQRPKPDGTSSRSKPIEDMVQCKKCGAYVPATTVCSCGKS